MNKLETLKCIEITSQRQANNGTISYYDPQTQTYYNLYENGYVRRSFGRKRHWTGQLAETIYQLNPTRMQDYVSSYDGKTYQSKVRIMLNTHDERMDLAARAVTNYRKTIVDRNIKSNARKNITTIQEKLYEYATGNLTAVESLNSIKELIK